MLHLRHHAAKDIYALILALTAILLTGCDSNSDLASSDIPSNDVSNESTRNDNRKVKRGQYRYLTDAAMFTECNTGQSWPIAPSQEAAEIERAYLTAASQDNQATQPITISIETHIDIIDGIETGTQKSHLVIDRFIGIDADQHCNLPQAELIGTYWRLNRVASFDAMPAGLREEPRIILDNDGNMKGHGGCNAMFGQYTLHEDALKFSGIAGTRMACPKIMPLESAVHLALSNTASYRIDGQYLYLETESGQLLAALEAVYLY